VLLVAAVIVNVNHYQTYQLLLDFYVTLTPLVLSGTPAQSQGYCAIPGHKQILSNVDLEKRNCKFFKIDCRREIFVGQNLLGGCIFLGHR
jgi:hypothetical protein